MSKNSKENKEVTTSFTVDAEDTSNEMPSVTRLLNRKSFAKSTTLAPDAKPVLVPPISPEEQTEPTTLVEPEPAPVLVLTSKPGRRRTTADQRPLHVWVPASLRDGNDPLGKALASLVDTGVTQALFLSIQPQPGKLPVFIATAAVNAGPKQSIWTGICWDPSVLPGVWSQLVSAGFVELPSPGTITNLHSERNVSRSAFDISPEEGLYLVRVGTPQQCRGIVALVSKKSLTAAIKQVAPLLNESPPAAVKIPA